MIIRIIIETVRFEKSIKFYMFTSLLLKTTLHIGLSQNSIHSKVVAGCIKYNKIKTSHSGRIGSASGATEARDGHSKCIASDLLHAQKETDGVKGCSISIHKMFLHRYETVSEQHR